MLWTTALDLKDDESGQPVGETHARSRLALRCAELLEGEQRFAAAIRMYTRCVHIDDNPFSPYSKASAARCRLRVVRGVGGRGSR